MGGNCGAISSIRRKSINWKLVANCQVGLFLYRLLVPSVIHSLLCSGFLQMFRGSIKIGHFPCQESCFDVSNLTFELSVFLEYIGQLERSWIFTGTKQ